jgi:hypothetical protein
LGGGGEVFAVVAGVAEEHVRLEVARLEFGGARGVLLSLRIVPEIIKRLGGFELRGEVAWAALGRLGGRLRFGRDGGGRTCGAGRGADVGVVGRQLPGGRRRGRRAGPPGGARRRGRLRLRDCVGGVEADERAEGDAGDAEDYVSHRERLLVFAARVVTSARPARAAERRPSRRDDSRRDALAATTESDLFA